MESTIIIRHIKRRKKGLLYHYFNGAKVVSTYDTGKDEDIERHKFKNYFDSHNARLLSDYMKNVFKPIE